MSAGLVVAAPISVDVQLSGFVFLPPLVLGFFTAELAITGNSPCRKSIKFGLVL